MSLLLDPPGSRLLAAFRADMLHGAPLPCMALHPDDFMLRFFLGCRENHREGAIVDYLRSGLSASRAIERLLQWWFGPRRPTVRLLDFASGFGRVTRHLVQHHEPQRLWVSDIFPAAVDFQRRTFGVSGFLSTARPEDLEYGETFDCVVACSMFSHLPEDSFVRWMRRLHEFLRPGGLLLVSVHDLDLRALLGAPPEDPPSGFLFEPSSEIPELDQEAYGTTWVSKSFMHEAVREATGASVLRLPRALSSFQDVYAIGVGVSQRPVPEVGEPNGWLERADRSADGSWITLAGWAHDLYGPGLAGVEVRLDGDLVARCPAELPRPDVGAHYGREGLRAGWAVSVGGDATSSTMLSVKAVGVHGAELLIHLGSMEGTDLGLGLREAGIARRRAEAAEASANARAVEAASRAAEEASRATAAAGEAAEATHHAEKLSREMARMRASRFWKLRDAWWSLKGSLKRTS